MTFKVKASYVLEEGNFSKFEVTYTTTIERNGYQIPAAVTCVRLGTRPGTLKTFQRDLQEIIADTPVPPKRPKGLVRRLQFKLEGIHFTIVMSPMTAIEDILPQIWDEYRTAVKNAELQYDLRDFPHFINKHTKRIRYEEYRNFKFEFDQRLDLYRVIEMVLRNFTEGTIEDNRWTLQTPDSGLIEIEYDSGHKERANNIWSKIAYNLYLLMVEM